MGTLTHKALELLASKKFAQQNKQSQFTDDELNKSWLTDKFTEDDALEEAWKYYTEVKPTLHTWGADQYEFCQNSMNKAMTVAKGSFNPLNRTVIWPEKYFDFPLEEEWAKYDFTIKGQQISGFLSLKGTMDLVCETRKDGVIELVDWKTGSRKDWNTGHVKDWKSLRNDSQLRLYHYALSKLCPQAKEIIVTIVFINDGGPYSLDFNKSDLPKTERIIADRFMEIKRSKKPKLIWGDRTHGWKCHRLCHYGKTKYEGSDKSICQYINREIIKIGLDRVTDKYIDVKSLGSYTGGGRTCTSSP